MSRLKIRLLFISLLFLSLYLFRLYSVQFRSRGIPDQARVRLVGRVSQQPYLKGSNQIMMVNGFSIRTGRFPGYFYGQKLEIVGRVTKRVINPLKSQFVLYYPVIQALPQTPDSIDKTAFVRVLFKIRGHFEKLFSRVLPEPQASLLAGILLGAKREMPQDFLEALRKTGTLHIIVASGYNISVVAGFLVSGLVRLVSRKKALILAFLGIIAYTLMAGAEPPVVRAAIMGSLTYWAQYLGREKNAITALVFAAVVMLLVSPLILFDIGFQLSFLATAGILFLYPRLQGRIFKLPLLGDDLKVTLAAQIATLPILVLNFGQISFISPLINALVLPITPLIMFLGALVIGSGLLFWPLAQFIAWLTWVPLTYFVKLIEGFSNLAWVSFSIDRLSIWWAVGYYFLIGLWLLKTKSSKSSSLA